MHWTFFLQDELPTWNWLMTFLLTLKMVKKYLKKDKYTIFYFPLFKAIRFFLPLLPALEASCFPGLVVTDEDDTADVILSLMCSLMLIMLLLLLLFFKLALSELVGGGRVVVGMLCLLSSR